MVEGDRVLLAAMVMGVGFIGMHRTSNVSFESQVATNISITLAFHSLTTALTKIVYPRIFHRVYTRLDIFKVLKPIICNNFPKQTDKTLLQSSTEIIFQFQFHE